MSRKIFTVLLFAVVFISGIFFINAKMPQDKASLTVPYSEKQNVYIPPDAKSVENFNAGGMALATVGLASFKQSAVLSGSQNFVSTSTVDGKGWGAVSVVKVDYYSIVPMASGVKYVVTASEQLSLATGKSLEWGGFHSKAPVVDIAKGEVNFPMVYSQGNVKRFFLWVPLLIFNTLLCGAISYGFWKAANKFKLRIILVGICESFKKFSPRLLTYSTLRFREKKTM